MDSHYESNTTFYVPPYTLTRRLILIGLEGVGKTTLINKTCSKDFPTSDQAEACPVAEGQYGSFIDKNTGINFELFDMWGINYKEPGKWQLALSIQPKINGVIFCFGNNPRESSLGELPRFADYCKNLNIPVLYITRDLQLERFQPCTRITCELDANGKFSHYTNLDEVKKKIVSVFENSTEEHQLLDPIVLCSEVKNLRSQNEKLTTDLETHISNHEKEREANKKQLEDYQMEMKQSQAEWQKHLEEYNTNNLALAKKLDEVSKEAQQGMNNLANQLNTVVQEKVRIQMSYDVLTEEKKKLDQKYVRLTNLKAEVDNQMRDLQRERDELQQKKDDLEKTKVKLINEKKKLESDNSALSIRRRVFMQNVEHMIRTLLTKGGQIASIGASKRGHTVKTKPYQRNSWFLVLPGSGFSVATEYDQLAKNISDLISEMVTSLSHLQQEDQTDIVVNEEVTVPVTDSYSHSNSYHSTLTSEAE